MDTRVNSLPPPLALYSLASLPPPRNTVINHINVSSVAQITQRELSGPKIDPGNREWDARVDRERGCRGIGDLGIDQRREGKRTWSSCGHSSILCEKLIN